MDTKLSAEVMSVLGQMKGRAKTVLIASHDPIVYDSEIVDRVMRHARRDDYRFGEKSVIIHPAVIALIAGSIMVSFLLLLSASFGVSILKRWDIRSGSELQLILERTTYLISA